jgi:hypothetical protein
VTQGAVVFAVGGLFLLNCLIFAPWIFQLGPFNDDWMTLRELEFSQWYYWLTRPFGRRTLAFVWSLLRLIGGSDPSAFVLLWYVATWAMHLLSSILLFITLRALGPLMRAPVGWSSFAFLTSALFTVYPADQARLWLGASTLRLGMTLLLLSYLSLVKHMRTLTRSWAGLSLLAAWLAVLSHEQLIPLAVLSPLMIAWMARRRLRFAGWAAIGLLIIAMVLWPMVSVWRMGHFFSIPNMKAGLVAFDLPTMVTKPLRGYYITFLYSWWYASSRLVREVGFGALAVGWSLLALAVMWWSAQSGPVWADSEVRQGGKRDAVQPYVRLSACGLGLVLLGYAVLIPTTWGIHVGTIDSRVNFPSSLGAALCVSAVVMVASVFLAPTPRGARGIFGIVMATAIGIGGAHQWGVGRDYRQAWAVQKQVWQDMFRLAPSFADGTYVLITGLPRSIGSASPLASPWEVTAALRALYGNPTLGGDVLFDDEPREPHRTDQTRIRFLETSLLTRSADPVAEDREISYDSLAIFHYHQGSGRLTVVTQLPGLGRVKASPARLRAGPVPPSPFRRLVGG